MRWMMNFVTDFFFAFGVCVVVFMIIVSTVYDGHVEGVSTAWFVVPSGLFALLRVEMVHWPRERSFMKSPDVNGAGRMPRFRYFWIGITPFIWHRPKRDDDGFDVVYRAGPFSLSW